MLLESFVQPLSDVLHHFIPVDFIEQFMPGFRVQFQVDVIDIVILHLAHKLPDTLAVLAHRICLAADHQNGQVLGIPSISLGSWIICSPVRRSKKKPEEQTIPQ